MEFHELPPVVLEMAVPAAPTARHAPPDRHETPFSACAPVFEPPFQLVPSVVKRTTAAPLATAPTATHPFAWKHDMPLRLVVVPLVCVSHDWPPFAVLRIVPVLPAA